MSSKITLRSGGQDLAVESFQPVGTPNRGAIVLAYGIDGLNKPWETMIHGYARALAKGGFVVLLPDYLAMTGTTPGAEAVMQLFNLHKVWAAAVSDTIDHARTLPTVDPARVGLLGFSLGGHLCLRLRSKAKVLVEFFAPVFKELGGIGPRGTTLAQAQIHHGEKDNLPATRISNADEIEGILKGEGLTPDLRRYPNAGHGFITKFGGTDAGNKDARTKSRARTLSFFAAHLGS